MNKTPILSTEEDRRSFQKCTERDVRTIALLLIMISYILIALSTDYPQTDPWCAFLNLETRNLICAFPLVETRTTTINRTGKQEERLMKMPQGLKNRNLYLFKCLWYQVKICIKLIYTVNFNTWYMYFYRDKNWQIWHFKYPRWF
jgi:hypothetical protein